MPIRTKIPPAAPWPSLPTTHQSDVDLLARIKRCEPDALGELYDRCGKLAYSIILRIVPEEDVAEDLLAQTFVTVWNQIERWKDARIEDLRLWLLLLARDQAIEYLRSRNEQLPKSLPHPNALIQPSVLQDFPRPRELENWTHLRAAFESLTPKETRILEMACFDGMTASEIAVTLGEPVAAVKDAVDSSLLKLARD